MADRHPMVARYVDGGSRGSKAKRDENVNTVRREESESERKKRIERSSFVFRSFESRESPSNFLSSSRHVVIESAT